MPARDSDDFVPQFTWLHLSDHHFGHGDADHQGDSIAVHNRLRQAILDWRSEHEDWKLNAVLVTGDIAYSGKWVEYERALEWFGLIREDLKLTGSDFYFVPGNHDANVFEAPSEVADTVELLFESGKSLGDALRDSSRKARLESRFKSYVRFLKEFQAASACQENPFLWKTEIPPTGASEKYQLIGANTAWLSSAKPEKEEKGKQQLDLGGFTPLFSAEEEVIDRTLLLTHHPLNQGWFRPEKDVRHAARGARFHLNGHTHVLELQDGSPKPLRLSARACHADKEEEKSASELWHGFSFGAIGMSQGHRSLRIFPWRTSSHQRNFVVDSDNCDRGENFKSYVLEFPKQPGFPNIPKPPSNDLEEYLKAVRAEYGTVPLLGFSARQQVHLSLDKVFVHLQVDVSLEAERELELEFGGEDKLQPRLAEEIRGDLHHVLRKTRNKGKRGLVLVGKPGAGKTTLLKHLASVAADPKRGSATLGLKGGLIPIYLRCGRLKRENAKLLKQKTGLNDLVRSQLKDLDRGNHLSAINQAFDSKKPFLFLFDSLDEQTNDAFRSRLFQWISQEMEKWPGSHFIIACRLRPWLSLKGSHQNLPAGMIEDLSNREPKRLRDRFIQNWYRTVETANLEQGTEAYEDAEEEGNRRAKALCKALKEDKSWMLGRRRSLACNPLLLSLLCLVHRNNKELPKERVELYRLCLQFLLEVWTQDKEQGKPIPARTAQALLQPLAWEMHQNAPAAKELEGGKDDGMVAISRNRAKRNLEQSCQGLLEGSWTAKEFLDLASDKCGVLQSTDTDEFAFTHLSFQEYLAARHAQDRGWATKLTEHLKDEFWKETLLLAMAMPGVWRPFFSAVAEQSLKGKSLFQDESVFSLLRECIEELTYFDSEPFRKLTSKKRPSQALIKEQKAANKLLSLFQISTPDVPAEMQEAAARSPEPGTSWRDPLIEVEWLWVPSGGYWMGSTKDPNHPVFDSKGQANEKPARYITIADGFWAGRFPVTNGQFSKYLADSGAEPPGYWDNPKYHGDAKPVVGVSWTEARRFCQWLNEFGKPPNDYRFDLPTEAQWEFMARGTFPGTSPLPKFPWGTAAPTSSHAHFASNVGPAPVGNHSKGASPLGIEDLSGNVWEWCLDQWSADYSKHVDLIGEKHFGNLDALNSFRVVRGGSWIHSDPNSLRCAYRNYHDPRIQAGHIGFRVVCRRALNGEA